MSKTNAWYVQKIIFIIFFRIQAYKAFDFDTWRHYFCRLSKIIWKSSIQSAWFWHLKDIFLTGRVLNSSPWLISSHKYHCNYVPYSLDFCYNMLRAMRSDSTLEQQKSFVSFLLCVQRSPLGRHEAKNVDSCIIMMYGTKIFWFPAS